MPIYPKLSILLIALLLGGCANTSSDTNAQRSTRLQAFLPPVFEIKYLNVEITKRRATTHLVLVTERPRDRSRYIRLFADAAAVRLARSQRFSRLLQHDENSAFASLESGIIKMGGTDGTVRTVFIIGRKLLIDERRQVFETKDDLITFFEANH